MSTRMSTAKEMVELALKFTEPPFGVYHNDIEIGDKNGHVCTAENSDIAKDIVAALNLAALRTLPSSDQCVAREALEGLYKEVAGIWSAFETALRQDISNTNYNCVQLRLDAAKAALAVPQAAVADNAVERVLHKWQEKLSDLESMKARGDLTKDWGECSLINAKFIVEDLVALTNPAPTELEGE